MKIIYYIIFFFWYLLSLLPLSVLYVFSDLLYFPIYYCVRYRRRIVRKNLTESFPELSKEKIIRIEKQYYHFFCDYIIETLKLFSISKKQLKRRMTFGGVEEIVKKMETEEKNFCFVYLGHYCNWEWIASLPYWIPDDILCGQIYHPLYNRAFNKLFLRLRNQFGGECISMKERSARDYRIETSKAKDNYRFHIRPNAQME